MGMCDGCCCLPGEGCNMFCIGRFHVCLHVFKLILACPGWRCAFLAVLAGEHTEVDGTVAGGLTNEVPMEVASSESPELFSSHAPA